MNGRKRFIVVDSLGLIWGLCVLPADHQDRDGGRWLLSQVRRALPRLREIIADSGFSRKFIDWVRRVCGWKVTTTATATKGFKVHPETSEALIYAAMIHLMLRRLPPLP